MKLNIGERLILLSILPVEGDFTTLKIVRKLRESLSFTEEEYKRYEFRQEEGNVFWNPQNNDVKDIHIGEKAHDLISSALKKLNDDKKLNDQHFDLYVKFVGDK